MQPQFLHSEGCCSNQKHPEGLAGVSFPFHSPGQHQLAFPFSASSPPSWRLPPLGRLLAPVTPMLTEALSGRRGAGWWLLPLRLQCALWLARWRGAEDDGGAGACDAAASVTFRPWDMVRRKLEDSCQRMWVGTSEDLLSLGGRAARVSAPPPPDGAKTWGSWPLRSRPGMWTVS